MTHSPLRFTLRAGLGAYFLQTLLRTSQTVVGGMEAGPERVDWEGGREGLNFVDSTGPEGVNWE